MDRPWYAAEPGDIARAHVLELACRAAGVGVHDYDVVRDVITWDDQVRAFWGIGPDERVTYATFEAGVHPDDRDTVRTAVAGALSGEGDGRYEAEYRVISRDGTERWIAATGQVIFSGGRPVRLVGIAQDVTGRRHAAADLREAATRLATSDRHRAEFLAVLAHELRTPLSAIRAVVPVLEQRRDGDMATRAFGILRRQVDQLTRLVGDLRDSIAIVQGHLVLRRQVVDLGGLITTAVEAVTPACEARGHQVRVDTASSLRVDGDPARLLQALGNVLDNAAKYTPSGGRIHVTARRDSDAAEIVVTDSGLGIAPSDLARVFDLYHRVAPPDHDATGLGIGLALVRRIVDLHDGTISVESDGPGHGTRVTIRLPALAEADVAPDQRDT